MKKTTSFLVLVLFLLNCVTPPQGLAQTLTAVGLMPQPGTSVALSAAYTPAHLWGLTIHPNEPFTFDFLVHRGDEEQPELDKKNEYSRLVKYFLAALAVPDTDQWVNLSPYEQDRIIPDNFGLTEMGRDLLAQDYLLKQLASSLTDPDSDLGKKFWQGVYGQAKARFGTTDVPTDLFNKVWILPDKAVVYEKSGTVYVLESHLKVMLEQDYLAMKNNAASSVSGQEAAVADISTMVMRDIIVPALEREVNTGRGFAPLRQVYSGMLLATWYKRALKETILGQLYANQSKVKGVDQDPQANQAIYDQYVAAFRKGVFNMIKEEVDQNTQEITPRKYFSGGTINAYDQAMIVERNPVLAAPAIRDNAQKTDVAQIHLQNSSIGSDNQSDAAMAAEVASAIRQLKTWFGNDARLAAVQTREDVLSYARGQSGLSPFSPYKAELEQMISQLAVQEPFDAAMRATTPDALELLEILQQGVTLESLPKVSLLMTGVEWVGKPAFMKDWLGFEVAPKGSDVFGFIPNREAQLNLLRREYRNLLPALKQELGSRLDSKSVFSALARDLSNRGVTRDQLSEILTKFRGMYPDAGQRQSNFPQELNDSTRAEISEWLENQQEIKALLGSNRDNSSSLLQAIEQVYYESDGKPSFHNDARRRFLVSYLPKSAAEGRDAAEKTEDELQKILQELKTIFDQNSNDSVLVRQGKILQALAAFPMYINDFRALVALLEGVEGDFADFIRGFAWNEINVIANFLVDFTLQTEATPENISVLRFLSAIYDPEMIKPVLIRRNLPDRLWMYPILNQGRIELIIDDMKYFVALSSSTEETIAERATLYFQRLNKWEKNSLFELLEADATQNKVLLKIFRGTRIQFESLDAAMAAPLDPVDARKELNDVYKDNSTMQALLRDNVGSAGDLLEFVQSRINEINDQIDTNTDKWSKANEITRAQNRARIEADRKALEATRSNLIRIWDGLKAYLYDQGTTDAAMTEDGDSSEGYPWRWMYAQPKTPTAVRRALLGLKDWQLDHRLLEVGEKMVSDSVAGDHLMTLVDFLESEIQELEKWIGDYKSSKNEGMQILLQEKRERLTLFVSLRDGLKRYVQVNGSENEFGGDIDLAMRSATAESLEQRARGIFEAFFDYESLSSNRREGFVLEQLLALSADELEIMEEIFRQQLPVFLLKKFNDSDPKANFIKKSLRDKLSRRDLLTVYNMLDSATKRFIGETRNIQDYKPFDNDRSLLELINDIKVNRTRVIGDHLTVTSQIVSLRFEQWEGHVALLMAGLSAKEIREVRGIVSINLVDRQKSRTGTPAIFDLPLLKAYDLNKINALASHIAIILQSGRFDIFQVKDILTRLTMEELDLLSKEFEKVTTTLETESRGTVRQQFNKLVLAERVSRYDLLVNYPMSAFMLAKRIILADLFSGETAVLAELARVTNDGELSKWTRGKAKISSGERKRSLQRLIRSMMEFQYYSSFEGSSYGSVPVNVRTLLLMYLTNLDVSSQELISKVDQFIPGSPGYIYRVREALRANYLDDEDTMDKVSLGKLINLVDTVLYMKSISETTETRDAAMVDGLPVVVVSLIKAFSRDRAALNRILYSIFKKMLYSDSAADRLMIDNTKMQIKMLIRTYLDKKQITEAFYNELIAGIDAYVLPQAVDAAMTSNTDTKNSLSDDKVNRHAQSLMRAFKLDYEGFDAQDFNFLLEDILAKGGVAGLGQVMNSISNEWKLIPGTGEAFVRQLLGYIYSFAGRRNLKVPEPVLRGGFGSSSIWTDYLSVDPAQYGGIDFAQSNLDMQIQRDANGVPLPVNQQHLEGIRIDGLVPVIINIRPATPALLLSQAGLPEPAAV